MTAQDPQLVCLGIKVPKNCNFSSLCEEFRRHSVHIWELQTESYGAVQSLTTDEHEPHIRSIAKANKCEVMTMEPGQSVFDI